MHSEQLLDKKQLRLAFDRAAGSYDQAAVLQREISNRMQARLEYIKYRPDVILDAGSGTGYGTQQLARRYPQSRLIAVDLARAMLMQARPNTTWWQRMLPLQQHTDYVCADIEQLPFGNESVGLIWSNLALQWCNDLQHTFAEMHRILRTDGLLMFSTFGPDTLKELRQSFASIDRYSHVNRFVDMHDIGDLLLNNRFSTPVMDMEYITLTYESVKAVLLDLKAIGAQQLQDGRNPGLMGKSRWSQLVAAYERLRRDGRLSATYEVVYGHAWKAQPKPGKTLPDGRQIVEFKPRPK